MSLDKLRECDIILLCGLYGSGKTEFSEKYFKDAGRNRISRLELRKLIHEMTKFCDPWTAEKFSEEDDVLVKHVERKIVEHYIHNRRKVLIINTFMTEKSRARFLKIAKQMKKTIGAIFLDIPVAQCIKQNEDKNIKIVTGRIIEILHRKKEIPTKKEGFDEVLLINEYDPRENPSNC